jgi:ABC-2 type transport system permease protein
VTLTSSSAASSAATAAASVPAPGPRVGVLAATAVIYRAQLARARVARASLLFVATLQSVGILVLLREVVDGSNRAQLTRQAVVAGSTVLVVAFVGLNLLAQRFGALRAAGALDHYATLPAAPVAVVLGTAASYATFTVPGTVLTAVVGALLFGLPLGHLWILAAVLPAAGASLAGLGAVLGLGAPRPELATVAGQLGMTAVLFLGVLPPDRLPVAVQVLRAAVPSTYAVDALAESFNASPDWASVAWHLGVCGAVAVLSLGVATWAFRRAVSR